MNDIRFAMIDNMQRIAYLFPLYFHFGATGLFLDKGVAASILPQTQNGHPEGWPLPSCLRKAPYCSLF